MATPNTREHTDAVVTALTAAGLSAQEGEKPDGAGWQGTEGQSEFVPYAIVFSGTETLDGPLGAPDDDGQLVRQVTYVGQSHEQAEWARDKGRSHLLANGLTVSGRSTERVALDIGVNVTRDDDVQPSVWMAVDHYRIFSFPT